MADVKEFLIFIFPEAERVKPLRFAERSGQYDAFFKNFNDGMTAAAAAR
jgi:hypothetical protein